MLGWSISANACLSTSKRAITCPLSMPGFIISLRNPPPLDELGSIPGISRIEPLSATQFRVWHALDGNPGSTVITLAEQRGWQLEQLTPLHATLEEVYAKITGAEPAAIGDTK